MSLRDQIEDFQTTMDKVMELVEETKTLAGQIGSMSIDEAPAKMSVILDLCADGIKTLQDATSQAEDIQKTVGG